ncbi:DUF3817 domain-containing protein [Burkholderia cenocepacia]|uniref:DUF3817 domain-containing protein n=1 Tax=Burkholderia cenocepacia TaxID=95486 RepID=UPI001906EC08|nr:DUF3817 domain-containing protein [Burkholderia cenocepacia]MBJ9696366.1 DUF3817 domain-containing protein [Burkholderia cenocepacia]
MDASSNLLRMLRLMAAVEATTLVLLVCVAVPLKHLGGMPMAVKWLGPVHGAAFVMYLWMVGRAAASQAWRRADVIRLVVAAMIPFGGFTSIVWLARKQVAR